MEETQRTPLILNPPPNIVKVTTLAQVDELVVWLRANREFGFDLETTPLKDFYWRKCRTVQFGTADKQFVIDLLAFCKNSDDLYNQQGKYGVHLSGDLKLVFERIAPFLISNEWLKVGVSLGFEYMTFYWNFGIRSCGFFDCSLAERVIYAGLHSLKDYGFFSMGEMFGRYFLMEIDKSLQESFNLESPLTDAQYEYAALDTRTPLAIRTIQLLILQGLTPRGLDGAGKPKLAEYLRRVDPLVLGDNLMEPAKIENDAIGAFQDMHIHGENLDKDRWLARDNKNREELRLLIANELDPVFLPIVGSKYDNTTDAEIEAMELEWKSYNNISGEEIGLRNAIRMANHTGDAAVAAVLIQQKDSLEAARKATKEEKKKLCGDAKKRRTQIRNLAAECEGEALINYGSDAQLLKVLRENFARLEKLPNLKDDTLEKFEKIPVMVAIRKYHGLSKEIGTYGVTWVTEWKTGPDADEGWLHPGDGKLHPVYNQFEAKTGRSSSEKPNGQNCPEDKELRSSFVADPPDESIRISDCCESETQDWGHAMGVPSDQYNLFCGKCQNPCITHSEEYVYVTADMSGAELRIIAEGADDPIWIGAFNRGEDVHSVGTEVLRPDEWPKLLLPSIAKPNGWTLQDCKDEVVLIITAKELGDKDKKIGPCAYYALKADGTYAKQKCNCPDHAAMRNDNKSTNFLLAYGGGAGTLAKRIKKSVTKASELMRLHEQKFPNIWKYLAKLGRDAKLFGKAFDIFGGRRIFPSPTEDRARENFIEYKKDQLELDKEEQVDNIRAFTEKNGRKPTPDEKFALTHRLPTSGEISKQFIAMSSSIERQGKNMPIQGANARIAKVAMGSGFDTNGKPFLWHTLPQYRAKLVKFVHDELVVQAPKRHATTVAELVGDAFKRAAALHMSKVVMEFDYKVSRSWSK